MKRSKFGKTRKDTRWKRGESVVVKREGENGDGKQKDEIFERVI